jgi:hypothetical protein
MSPEGTLAAPKSKLEGKEGVKLSFAREQLDAILQNPEHTPQEVLTLFEKDFGSEFGKDAGVWEGYSLREHTGMVLNQYRKYFYSGELPSGVDKNFMEVLLTLHDIGKPEAIAHGDKYKQHEYTEPVLRNTLGQLGYDEKDIALASAVVDGDAIGEYLKGGDASRCAQEVMHSADKAGMPVDEFWKLLKVYYQSDAGSYTADAGGKPSLDRLFVFDPQRGSMQFAPETGRKVEQLYKEVKRLDAERPPDQGSLREFSREQDPAKRKELADELRAKRREYFEGKRSTQEKIESVQKTIEERSSTLEIVTAELEEISSDIESRKTSKISQIANYFKLKELRERLGSIEQKKEEVAADLDRNRMILDQLDAVMSDQSALTQARSEVQHYYGSVGEEYKHFEAEERGRDVGNMIREHNAFFFHGINTEADEAQKVNGVINPDIPVGDRLKLLLSLEPSISTSTIKQGATMKDNLALWSRAGVLLNGGRIDEAGRGDIASVSSGIGRRETSQTHYKKLGSVSEAIESRGDGYNELVIREPKIAGYYLWVDAGQKWPIPLSKSRQEEFQGAAAMGLPLYTVIDGRVIKSFLVNEGAGLLPGPEEVSPESLLQRPAASLDETRRSELREDVLNDATFNMEKFERRIPEIAYIQGMRAGKQLLERFQHPVMPQDYEYASSEQYAAYNQESRTSGRYHFAISGDEIPVEKMTPEDYQRAHHEFFDASTKYVGINGFNLGDGSYAFAGKGEERLKSIKDVAVLLERDLARSQDAVPDGKSVRLMSGICYGLADALEAVSEPDRETVEKLRTLGERYVSKEQFEDVKSRRLDEKGRFKISADEIV